MGTETHVFNSNPFEAVHSTRQLHSANELQLAENHYFKPDVVIGLHNFDVNEHFNSLNGPAIEVGGPTPTYHVMLGNEPPHRMFVSNKYPDDPNTIDLRIDASSMPFRDESVGSLFSSYLPIESRKITGEAYNLHEAFMGEAYRCLEPGGLLVMQGMIESEILFASENGFTPVRIMESQGSLPLTGEYSQWDCIMMKGEPDPEGLYVGRTAAETITADSAMSLGNIAISGPGTTE